MLVVVNQLTLPGAAAAPQAADVPSTVVLLSVRQLIIRSGIHSLSAEHGGTWRC